MPVSFDSRQLRNALGQFPTGVVIVTAQTAGGERIGMTMSSFNSVSLDPPLVLFSVHRNALTFVHWQEMKHYAINILGEDQEELSNSFARAKSDKWEGVNSAVGENGAPILPGAIVTFECEAYSRYDGGDHEIFVGRILKWHEGRMETQPLVFYGGKYRQLTSIADAHTPPSDTADLHGWVSDLHGW